MNSYKHLKNVLFHIINNLSNVCSIFCVNPDTDFTRNRKLDFETTMKIVLCMGASPIKDELLKFNDFSIATPSASAFVQARSKIKPEGGFLWCITPSVPRWLQDMPSFPVSHWTMIS